MDRRAHLCLDRSQSQARSRLRAIRLHRRCLRPPRHDPYHAQTLDQGNSLSLNQDFPNRLSGFARAVDSTSVAVLRGNSVLATLGGWLLEPRGYDRVPVIDIRMTTGSGLIFATGLPKVGDVWRLSGTPVRFAGYTALGRLTYRELAVPAPGSLRSGQPKADAILRVAILDGISEG